MNLHANPDVTVKVGGGAAQAMRAEVASAEERARLWPIVSTRHSNYAGYQKRTNREIPLALLRPVAP